MSTRWRCIWPGLHKVLAAQPAIRAAVEDGFAANVTVPVYLGDHLLQLIAILALAKRSRTGGVAPFSP